MSYRNNKKHSYNLFIRYFNKQIYTQISFMFLSKHTKIKIHWHHSNYFLSDFFLKAWYLLVSSSLKTSSCFCSSSSSSFFLEFFLFFFGFCEAKCFFWIVLWIIFDSFFLKLKLYISHTNLHSVFKTKASSFSSFLIEIIFIIIRLIAFFT